MVSRIPYTKYNLRLKEFNVSRITEIWDVTDQYLIYKGSEHIPFIVTFLLIFRYRLSQRKVFRIKFIGSLPTLKQQHDNISFQNNH